MKKVSFILLVLILLTTNIFGQIGFRQQLIQLETKKTDFEAVEIADVTNDGLNDIVVGSGYYFDSLNDYCLFIYKQNPNGTLASPMRIPYPNTYPGINDLEVGDFNNDKLNDIAICYGTTLGIFYQLPAGGFSTIVTTSGPYYANGIESGDLNHDGLTDLVGYDSEKYKLLLQQSTGGFIMVERASKTLYCEKLDVMDMNGDHYDDIVKVYGSKIEILYQKNGGSITKDSCLVIGSASGIQYSGLTLGDLNNDGRNDLAAVNGGNNGRMVLMYQMQNGKLDTLNAKTVVTYDIPTPVSIADLNCDGLNEIIIGHSGWNHISIFAKTATSEFSKYLLFPTIYGYSNFSMAVGDINGDLKPDVVSVGQNATVHISFNTSKPLTFDSIRYEVARLQIRQDTTMESTAISIPIPDTATYCKRNDYTLRTTLKTFQNTYYSGDSLSIRRGSICGDFCDTVVSPFSYNNRVLLQTTVSDSIVNKDSLGTSTDLLYVSSNKEGRILFIYSNTCWNIQTDANWITTSVPSGSGDQAIVIDAMENQFAVSREAIVSIYGDRAKPVQVKIHQYEAEPLAWSPANAVVLSDLVNNAAIIEIYSNCHWEVLTGADWITVDSSSGSGNTLLTVRATPNDTEEDRQSAIGLFYDGQLITYIPVLQLKKISKP